MNTQASRRNPSFENSPSESEEAFFITEKSAPEPVHHPFASETPGAQIRAIREAHNVSTEEVAKRLYLDVQMIKNLEADNYSRLPPPIFVQGYLRAFAKLFEVSEEPLLAAYLKYNPNANNPPALASENTAQMPKVGVGHHHSSGRWWYYVTWALVVGVTVLVAWRYAIQTHVPRNDNPAPENTSTTAITPPNNQAISTPYTPPSEGGGTKNPAITPPNAVSPSLPTTPPPVAITPLPSVNGAPSANGSAQTPSHTTTTPRSETSMISMNSASPSPDAGTIPTPPVAMPSEDANALILKFKDVSWARVVDSKKKKLYDGTSKPGQTVTIKEGVPPYEVSFNKVTTVDLFYKGQLMDLKLFRDQKTATLMVGKAPAGSAAKPEEDEEEE
jgi:cytoskeleton protein RodZ